MEKVKHAAKRSPTCNLYQKNIILYSEEFLLATLFRVVVILYTIIKSF